MGWMDGVESSVVTGYSYEDQEIFRAWYSTTFQSNGPAADENNLANAIVNAPVHRGTFVVAKLCREIVRKPDGSQEFTISESLVPFSKDELVDMCLWRRYCGRLGLVSSRLHRENMRRLEMQGYLSTQGFEKGSFQNVTYHDGL